MQLEKSGLEFQKLASVPILPLNDIRLGGKSETSFHVLLNSADLVFLVILGIYM